MNPFPLQMYEQRLEHKNRPSWTVLDEERPDSEISTADDASRNARVLRRVVRRIKRATKCILGIIVRFYSQTKVDIRKLISKLRHPKTSHEILGTTSSFIMDSWWRLFPLIYTVHELWLMYYKIMYLLDHDRWPYWSPYLRLQRMILR